MQPGGTSWVDDVPDLQLLKYQPFVVMETAIEYMAVIKELSQLQWNLKHLD